MDFLSVLGNARQMVEVVDVGAAWCGAETLPYNPLLKMGLARVTGFEARDDECARLNGLAMAGHRYLPYAIGDGSKRTLYHCADPLVSSLYEPNFEFRKWFNDLPEKARVVRTQDVQTRRMDDIPEITEVHFLKLDIQGAELDALRGAERLLGSALVVQTEVEFAPLYKDQPLFRDVDAYLHGRGFMLHRFIGAGTRLYRPFAGSGEGRAGQLLWTDAVYVPELSRLTTLAPEALVRLATVLLTAYGSGDLASVALRAHDLRAGTTLWEAFMRAMNPSMALPAPPL